MNKKSKISKIKKQLRYLSNALGNKEDNLVILGEGNTSARVDKKTFLIKAKQHLPLLDPLPLFDKHLIDGTGDLQGKLTLPHRHRLSRGLDF